MTFTPSSLWQTVTLGPGGPIVPAVGIGTWAWGDNLYWSYGQDYGEAELQGAFEGAIESGLTFFDTAEVYGLGESERLLGRFMQGLPPESRDRVQIATKYFPLPWRMSPQAVASTLEASLERLQATTIPLYQVHWPFDFFLGQSALLKALAEAVERGQIQAVGVSNYSAAKMRQAHQILADLGIPLASNQVQYSLLRRTIETNGVLATARELGVVILAYCPLAQGLLTGKYRAGQRLPGGVRSLNPRFQEAGLRRLEPLLQALQEVGNRHDRTPSQVALNWLVSQGTLPIPGAKTADHARQNAGALGWQLSPDEMAHLASFKNV